MTCIAHAADHCVGPFGRGLPLRVRPGLRAGRRLHDPDRDRRPGDQRRGGARAGAGVPRRGRRGRGVPRARADRLRDRRPAAAGHRARRGRGADRRRSSPASADLLPMLVVGAPLRHGNRLLQLRGRDPRAARCSGSRRSPTCRPTASSTSAGTSRPATTSTAARIERRRRTRSRSAPTCCSEATDVPGLVVHVEICEDMWVPVPPERRGGARRGHGAAQPVRQPDHRRARRGPPAAGARRRPRAAWPRTSMPRQARASRAPTCRGTARR